MRGPHQVVADLFRSMANPRKVFSVAGFRLLLGLSFLFVFGQYVRVMDTQAKSFDSLAAVKQMQEKGEILPLGEWEAHFFACVPGPEPASGGKKGLDCSKEAEFSSGENKLAIRFPDDATRMASLIAKVDGPMKVLLLHKFTEEEHAFIVKNRASVLAFPRSIQKHAIVQFGSQEMRVNAPASFSFPLDTRNFQVQGDKTIFLEIDPGKETLFGPQELPVALAKPHRADDYLGIVKRLTFSKEISSRMEIGFPLLLSGVALVLDHSAAFGLLSLFSMAVATRSYISFDNSHSGVWNPFYEYTYIGANGIAMGFLILFILAVCHLTPRRRSLQALVPLGCLVMAILVAKLWPDGLLVLDLVADATAAFLSMALVVLGFVVFWMRRHEARTAEGEESLTEFSILGHVAQSGILLLALGIHGFVNLSELIAPANGAAKNFLDWRHSVLSPALITAALVEMGSVTRKIARAAQHEARRAVLEKEMALGRAVQGRMLGRRRQNGEAWSSRSFYVPAVQLAGDWYDIREISYADGRRLVALVLADVTGHGVAAALVTSVLCSQWGQWALDSSHEPFPGEDAERELAVRHALLQMHMGVAALGKGDAATAAVVLLCPESGRFSYCTAGHPSIIHFTKKADGKMELRTVRTSAAQVGNANDPNEATDLGRWGVASGSLLSGEMICVYSDGLAAHLEGESKSFLKELQRQYASGPRTYPRLVLDRMWKLKRVYRRDPDIEDDITVLFLGYFGIMQPGPAA